MPMPYRTPPAPPHLSRPPVTVLASPISRPSLSLSLSFPLLAFSPVTVPPYRPSPLQDRHHVVIEDAAADAPRVNLVDPRKSRHRAGTTAAPRHMAVTSRDPAPGDLP
ncbi:hypothetical protein BU17DRAFT_95589 [Hysterangium stoloniferum]|nr:hypothetical protein BU17DRAFT_95589 [Hysterangium stoloniferum]